LRIIKPKRLTKKDVIGIISPASSPDDPSLIEKGVAYLERLGYKINVGNYVGKYNGYLAGSDEYRLNDFHQMFRDKEVKAIICVRGGYGAVRLLDKIDYKIVRNNPKIFVGYSEITALQMAIFNKTGLITFAGPMLTSDFANEISPFTEENFWRNITSNKKMGRLKHPYTKLPAITKGNATGRIIGGNLSVLLSLAGTEFFPELKKNILFIEDIDEKPYKIDRYLNQLRLNKVFKQISGVVLGRFVDCYEHNPEKRTLTLGEVIDSYFHQLDIPIVYTFPHGHIKDKITIPIGVNVKVNANSGVVEFTESGVR
jgi:muramoyltetrapeptide carboxypeptidase